MTAKRYQIFVNRKKFDYTYDAETGVWRWRMPRDPEFTTGQASTPEVARDDVRERIEEALRRGYPNRAVPPDLRE
jgi:hypothetical protein